MDESVESKRIVPHSIDAERAVLGAMLLGDHVLATIMERTDESDFYLPSHKVLYANMLAIYQSGHPVDEVTLINQLERRGLLPDAGGFTYVTDLQTALPTLANLDHYLSIVVENSTLRKLISAAQKISSGAYNPDKELAQVISGAEKEIFDISLAKAAGGLRHISNFVASSYVNISQMSSETGITGMPTGFIDLDLKLSGLQKSDLIIVAARPAMGKTSFAMNIAQHIAVRENGVVAVFELEMSQEQLTSRLLCTQAEVDMQKMRSGMLDDEDWNRLFEASGPLSKAPMYIDDTAGATISGIRSKLRRLKLEVGRVDLVVIDYLQLLTYDGKAGSRQLEVSEMTRTLKILARELDVPIMLLSQLSRAPEQRADHHPMMSDLRESGSIEQDADIIIMLYRESVYDENADDTAEVIITKHRNGPTGTVKMTWLGQYTKFADYTELEPPF